MEQRQSEATKEVRLQRIFHRQQAWWKLRFDYHGPLISLIKAQHGYRWSASHQAWLLPYAQYTEAQLLALFQPHAVVREPSPGEKPGTAQLDAPRTEHQQALTAFERWMRSQRYSANTIKTYKEALEVYLRFFGQLPPETLQVAHLHQFNNDYILKNGYSYSYQNQVINAIKLYYGKVLGSILDTNTLERPRKARRLPHVLSETDVKAILQRTTNLKHLSMLKMTYGCGLRCGGVGA